MRDEVSGLPNRLMPRLDPDNRFFWTSGRDGVLRFLRCKSCAHYIHPPTPMCPKCESFDTAPEAISGQGTVISFTINRNRWRVGFEPPYCVALVEFDEQPGLRLAANVVGHDLDDVHVGMRVTVGFEQYDTIFIPVFS